jgi:hypothetical protein
MIPTLLIGGLLFVALMVGLALLLFPVTPEPTTWRPSARNECDCNLCMEPGLRGPGRTSLD